MTQMHDLLFNLLYDNTTTLFEVYQEYLTYNDTTYIVKNDEDGLNDLFENDNVFDIIRATCYGSYTMTETYAKINDHGNLESFDYLEDMVDIHKIVDWMLGNKGDAGCAWDCICNDEILAFDLHFQEMFATDFALELDDVETWYNDYEDAFEHVIMTPWDELKKEFNDWVENNPTKKELQTKEEVFDKMENTLMCCVDKTLWFNKKNVVIQKYYGELTPHTIVSLRLCKTRNGQTIILQDADVVVDGETIREIDDVTHLSLEEMVALYDLMMENI